MPTASDDELRRVIEGARSHVETQRGELRRLEAELPVLNERLGRARVAQEHLQRPSTLVTEAGRQRVTDVFDRVRARLRLR